MDSYSNIMYVKEDFASLSHLAHQVRQVGGSPSYCIVTSVQTWLQIMFTILNVR